MIEPFEIPVIYKGERLLFPGKLLVLGYKYKQVQILIDVKGQEIMFEPDEEQNFREVIDPENLKQGKNVDVGLIKAVAEAIEEIAENNSAPRHI